jgi:hypothetical protein
MKVVINTCYGGFSLSKEAMSRLKELGNSNYDLPYEDSVEYRSNNLLVRVVEELGEKANGRHASLKIIEIPEDAHEPYIMDYDGMEHVAEGKRWY